MNERATTTGAGGGAQRRDAWLALLCVLALTPRAYANPVPAGDSAPGLGAAPEPPSAPIVVSMQPMPGNGALLLNDYGGHSHSLAITAPTGETIEGTYVQVWEFYWAWRPSAPLLPGKYLIESTNGPPLHQRNGALSSMFTVVEEVDLATPVLMSEPSVSLVSTATETLCCDLWTDFSVQIGACTPTAQQSFAALAPGLSSPTGSVALGQYLFAFWPPEMASTGYAPWTTPRELMFASEADEYCFEVEAIAIFDSSVHGFDALTPRCVPHGELGEIGPSAFEPPPSFFDRVSCTEPPDGYDDAWCEHNADCEDSDDVDCVMFDHLCEGGERPSWMPPNTGGFGGGFVAGEGGAAGMEVSGGAGGEGGESGEGGEGGESGDAGMRDSGGEGGGASPKRGESCSVHSAGTRAQSSAAWLALVVMLALAALRPRKVRA